MTDQERLAAFEAMLHQVEEDARREKETMDALKAQGKEKSATYRQLLGNRLMYTKFLAMYQVYGLRKRENSGESPLSIDKGNLVL